MGGLIFCREHDLILKLTNQLDGAWPSSGLGGGEPHLEPGLQSGDLSLGGKVSQVIPGHDIRHLEHIRDVIFIVRIRSLSREGREGDFLTNHSPGED